MKKKRLAVLAVALVLAFSGCGNPQGPAEEPQVELWSAYATDKIMRDVEYTERGPAVLSYEMAKNEVEGAQIIISPVDNYSVGSFTVEVSDLENEDGDVIPSRNIRVYLQKYINIAKKITHNPTYTNGLMPDALLPFDKAVEYGENTVSGLNQGIYVTVETEADTAAGEYNGTFKIILDGKTYNVPVEAEVWDFAISDEVHTKSVFEIWLSNLMYGELDGSDEMYNLYIEALKNYRLSSAHLRADTLEEFIEEAKKATADPRTSAFALPNNVVNYNDVNYPLAKQWIKEMLYESTEECCLIDKMVYQFGTLIDEPQLDSTGVRKARVNVIMAGMDNVEEEIIRELTEEGYFNKFSAEYKEHVEQTLRSIPNIVTAPYDEDYTDGKVTYCPMFDEFDSAENRAIYADQKEKNGNLWWYGCTGPVYPYPTYHTDDSLTGARILSWMQYDYGVDGNLYWSVNIYSAINNLADGNYTRPVNAWEETRRNTNENALNGDGYLFYPGLDYGIKGPVGSLRLEAIRDGNEEYEYLYELENFVDGMQDYYEEEISVQSMLRTLFDRLYTGTQYVQDSGNFYTVRSELAEVIERLNGEEKFLMNGITFRGEYANISFNVADGYEVKVNGQTVTGVTQGQGKKYTAQMLLDAPANYFEIEISDGQTVKNYSIFVSGKMTLASDFNAEEDISLIGVNNAEYIDVSYSEDPETAISGGSVKIEITSTFDPEDPLASLTYKPQLSIALADIGCDIDKLDSVSFSVYNASGEQISFRFCLYTSVGTRYELGVQRLDPGWNTVSFAGVNRTNWSQLSFTDRFVLEFSNTVNDENTAAMPEQILFIDDLLLSNVAEGEE